MSGMKGEKIFEGDVDVRYLFFPAQRQSSILLVTFSSFPELDMLPQYDFVDSLEEFDCHRLHLLDDFGSRGSYFLCRQGDYEIERSVVRLINGLCREQGIVRKIALGANEGGTAAVYYGVKYDFDTIIVETPHFYIGQYLKKLPDGGSILDFMIEDIDDEGAVSYLDDIVAQVIKEKKFSRTKVIICSRKEDNEASFQAMNIEHLVAALKERGIPYVLSVIENVSETDSAGFFSSTLKKQIAIHVPFSSLVNYEVEIAGNTLILSLTTANITDKVALSLCVNGEEVTSTWDSEKRKYYFDISCAGIYQFTVIITNTFEHRRIVKLTPIEVSKADDKMYKWVEVLKKGVKTKSEVRLENLQREIDTEFFSTIKDRVNKIPVSNGSRYYDQPLSVRIAIVADQAIFTAYDRIANCIYVTPDNYRDTVGNVDVFLVTNTWRGLSDEWVGLTDPGSEKKKQLIQMIDVYRCNGAKIVFYSEGDPEYYNYFLKIAKLCDYIFTISEEQVASYQVDCEHDDVYALRLGINPVVHNPIGFRKAQKLPGAIFAGGWDKESQYHESQLDARMIFDGVTKKSSLKIIDENFKEEQLQEVRYWFPDEYFKNVSPAVGEEELRKVCKLFDWAVCISKVKYSNTIDCRDVYALQASGSVVLSNYNEGINNLLPNVFTVFDDVEVSRIMSGFTDDELYEQQVEGIRKVMSKETNYQRLVEMMNVVGITVDYPVKRVAVVANALCERVSEMFHCQTYESKELLLESQVADAMLGDFDFIAFFSVDAEYGMYYLEDMINAFKYVDVDFVTKDAYYLDGKLQEGVQHDYVDCYGDKVRTVFSSENYWRLADLDDCTGYQGYAIDPFEFEMGEMRQSRQVLKRDYKLSIVVPVYNNGDHLLNKAFNSLLRSALFHEMEVIIIDDGSTDGLTPRIIERLANRYANVKTYLYPEGGSGSASRPRNKAIAMATADYIAFLDPDDEMINDGMRVLYEAIVGSNYDMVIGESLVVRHFGVLNAKHFHLVQEVNDGSSVVDNTKDFFVKMGFKPKRLQEIIIRKDLVIKHKLSMVVGALGQDTLFFQEAVLVSKKIRFIDEVVALYYGAVEGSAVNNVSVRLFEKYLIREKEAINRYIKHGVLDEFLALRFEKFFINWYFPRLKKVSDDEFARAVDTLREIIEVYRPRHNLRHATMVKFYQFAINRDYNTLREIYQEVS